jgi:hypothetical protein
MCFSGEASGARYLVAGVLLNLLPCNTVMYDFSPQELTWDPARDSRSGAAVWGGFTLGEAFPTIPAEVAEPYRWTLSNDS